MRTSKSALKQPLPVREESSPPLRARESNPCTRPAATHIDGGGLQALRRSQRVDESRFRMHGLKPIRSFLDDRTHQDFQPQLIAIVHYLFDFSEIKFALFGVEIYPGTIDANDVEFVLVGDCLQHFMP
jgi:hypothetical protein